MSKDTFILIGLLLVIVGLGVFASAVIMLAFNSGVEFGICAIGFFLAITGFLILTACAQ